MLLWASSQRTPGSFSGLKQNPLIAVSLSHYTWRTLLLCTCTAGHPAEAASAKLSLHLQQLLQLTYLPGQNPGFWSPANFTARPRDMNNVAAPSLSQGVSACLEALEDEPAVLPGPAAVKQQRSRTQTPFHHRNTETATGPVTNWATVFSHRPH